MQDTIERRDCDCERLFYTMIAVYRLWKCTSDDADFDALGIAGINPLTTRFRGNRNYWFPLRRPSQQRQCFFNTTAVDGGLSEHFLRINLTHGALPDTAQPSVGGSMFGPSSADGAMPGQANGALDLRAGLQSVHALSSAPSQRTPS